MADILKVTPEELQSTASQFKNYQTTLQIAYLTMSDAVRSLTTTWTGTASSQFASQFDSMYKNLSQTEEKMNDAIDELCKAHDIFQESEDAIKGQVDSLEEGTSPFA